MEPAAPREGPWGQHPPRAGAQPGHPLHTDSERLLSPLKTHELGCSLEGLAALST